LDLSQPILNQGLLILDIRRVLVTLLGGIDVGLLSGRLTLRLPLFLDVYSLTLGKRAVEWNRTLAGVIIEVSSALILLHVALVLILHDALPIFPFRGTQERVN
jgi:hypothetical protein